ncbi:hypothetical protein IE077_001323 [Cardiosporidium cionae]|uniref:Uncharacterized protein n=1 Tax=Cardiosporidium cionae TaxID=476202 RepID=A0ABQ7JDG7_9APIC|nr:hypothetical protein IE077_001323 [Cardiosporidium cionae]|eukprot:KAF8821955.1 hypothetical protein IE077_001323 [Cardiosporidium cionae]
MDTRKEVLSRIHRSVEVIQKQQSDEEAAISVHDDKDLTARIGTFEALVPPNEVYKDLATTDMDLYLEPIEKNLPWGKESSSEKKVENDMTKMKTLKIPVHSGFLKISSQDWLRDISALEMAFREKLRYSVEVFAIFIIKSAGELTYILNALPLENVQEERLIYRIRTYFPEAVRCIIRYLYGFRQDVDNADPLLLVAMYKEAERFKLDSIMRAIEVSFSKPHDLASTVEMAVAAEALLRLDLMYECSNCYSFFSAGMSEKLVAKKSKQLLLGPLAIHSLTCFDNIQLDEIQIFQSVAQWINQHEEFFGLFGEKDEEQWKAETELYKAIRFSSMSAEQIRDIRSPKLDSFLLEGCLKKFFGTEGASRVLPWKANEEFCVNTFGGTFPVLLRRAPPRGGLSSWAWTAGQPRMVSEAVWAIEIARTVQGFLHIGILMDTSSGNRALHEPHLACAVPEMARMSSTLYFDLEKKNFFSGECGTQPKIVNYRNIHHNSNIRWQRPVKSGDILTVQITVGVSSLYITIQVMNSKDMVAKFVYPHFSAVQYRGNVIKRPFLSIAPFWEMYHNGDELGIPILQVEK